MLTYLFNLINLINRSTNQPVNCQLPTNIYLRAMYYVIYGVFWLFSLLPWFVIYWLADFGYFLLYYLLGYRKQVVFSNLQIAFPEKSQEELTVIAKNFYHNFVDSFVEIIKFLTEPKEKMMKRLEFDN